MPIMSLAADRILFATDYSVDLGPAFLHNPDSGIMSEGDLAKVYRGNSERVVGLGGPA